ncbi:MAG: DUF4384 domain-containing protein [Pseudomonadota bacterium]
MIETLKKAALAGLLAVAGCATVESVDVPETARPNAMPAAAVTRFEDALDCMDNAFADFGVSQVTIQVASVPDYTGRAFVSSDIWLAGAIGKMSQRSKAFVVTDYNPQQLLSEQALWSMSGKEGFYIPAYYIRGSVSGFAGNVVENGATVGLGDPVAGGAVTSGRAYSLVSVDLMIGLLQQRTLIPRAQVANEVTMESRASGAQLAGILEKLGANMEIVASRSDGVPQAVRALIQLNAIEALGRLTGVPYWTCLGTDHMHADAVQIRRNVFSSMSAPERVVFVQRRLSRLGHYSGPLDGVESPALATAVTDFTRTQQLSSSLSGRALYDELTKWENRGELTDQRPFVMTTAPAKQPTEANTENMTQPLTVNMILTAPDRRMGAPVSVKLNSNRNAYAYCYLQDMGGAVSRVFPNRWQPDPIIPGDRDVEIPGAQAGFDLVLPQAGASENLVCFVSSRELGSALSAPLKTDDLVPLPITSLDVLKTEFNGHAAAMRGDLVIKQVPLQAAQ